MKEQTPTRAGYWDTQGGQRRTSQGTPLCLSAGHLRAPRSYCRSVKAAIALAFASGPAIDQARHCVHTWSGLSLTSRKRTNRSQTHIPNRMPSSITWATWGLNLRVSQGGWEGFGEPSHPHPQIYSFVQPPAPLGSLVLPLESYETTDSTGEMPLARL